MVGVNPDVLYLDDGDVFTGAGSMAGLGLCIRLVRWDNGPSVANALARLVTPPTGTAAMLKAVPRSS